MFQSECVILFILYTVAKCQENSQVGHATLLQEYSNIFQPQDRTLTAFWNANHRKNAERFKNTKEGFHIDKERLELLKLSSFSINELRNLSVGIQTRRTSRLKVVEVEGIDFMSVSSTREQTRTNATCPRFEDYDCSYIVPERYHATCSRGRTFITCIQTRNRTVQRTCTKLIDFCCDGYEVGASGYCERKTDRSGCGGNRILRKKTGSITTPGYPNHYGEDLDCRWTIEAAADELVVISFQDLDTEKPLGLCDLRRGHCFDYCDYDFIQIHFRGDNKTRTLCGSLLPQTEFLFPGSAVDISFTSDGSNQGRGFKLAYSVNTEIHFLPKTCSGGQVWKLCRRICLLTCEDTMESSTFGPWNICIKSDGTNTIVDTSSRDDVTCVPGCACPKERPIWHNRRCVKVERCRQKAFQCGIPLSTPSKKIVGGRTARDGDWPWIVQIANNYLQADCAGTLICSDWVATAAHCFLNRDTWTMPSEINVHQYWFHLGKYWKYDQRDQRRVESLRASRIIIHPEYNSTTDLNDLALIQLSGFARQWNLIRPICLPLPLQENITTEEHREASGGFPGINDQCTAAGWGVNRNIGPAPYRLKQARLPIKPASSCSYNSYEWRKVICAGGRFRADTCQGDSGGPFACHESNRWYLRGITSFGDGCADGIPGGYTRISNYMLWIRGTIGYECGV